jgi:hypothetical protein
LNFDEFAELMPKVQAVAQAVGRTLPIGKEVALA